MHHEVIERVERIADHLRKSSEEAALVGSLDATTVTLMKESGVVRMLQPTEFGGYEATPAEFLAAVMAFGKYDPAAGWIAGVVGVHPWELAMNDRRLQEEVWADDPDTWIASPYAPMGVARPVDGGYVLRGRWSFSSGTDHCDWVVLGAHLGDADGKPAVPAGGLHVMLPRTDYTIVDDSWNVMGLEGTGSKDVIVDDAFIPAYRAIDAAKVMDGRAAEESGRTQPLYRVPWASMFPSAISAGVVGIAEGVLQAALDYHRERVTVSGTKAIANPHTNAAIGEAASEIRSARTQLLYNAEEMYDVLLRGGTITMDQRVAARRDQIRVAWRAVEAADKVFAQCGGASLRLDRPLQRFWRSARAGLQHAIFSPGSVYDSYTRMAVGEPVPPGPGALF